MAAAEPLNRSKLSTLLRDLDQIAARVVEDGRGDWAHGDGRLREVDAGFAEAAVFGLHVGDAE
jgi:hypothetical protein